MQSASFKIITILALVFSFSAESTINYQISELQVGENYSTEPMSVNNAGQVAGILRLNQEGKEEIFFWDAQTGLLKIELPFNEIVQRNLDGVFKDAVISQNHRLAVLKITNAGTILINCATHIYTNNNGTGTSKQVDTAIKWTKENGTRIIEVPGVKNLRVLDGNDHDQILLSNGDQKLILTNKKERYIGVIDKPVKINNNGDVLGQILVRNKNKSVAILAILKPNGDIHKFPLDRVGEPIAFNDFGQIVGRAGERYFLWDEKSNKVNFLENVPVKINNEDAFITVNIWSIRDINNRGDLLGRCRKDCCSDGIEGVLCGSNFITFNDLLNIEYNLNIQFKQIGHLVKLNDNRQIIGIGQIADRYNVGFLLSPIDNPE